MYAKLKNFTEKYLWNVPAILIVPAILTIVYIICVWCYTDRTSNIDTTGIRNAENELRHAREYNQQSIDYNQRVRDAVENSKTLNERTEERIGRSVELNSRTENAIDRGTELIAKARTNAERAKTIIDESRDILRTAEKRNQKSENPTTK
ncbi:hypothetical protein [Veillonella montpellierensis]|uniref:hypothetical protein n=1 Tax=Veillonella montpellierensis TaxID=187328 RepID=UPI0023F6672C|nr:hypothetical protein [Veillonella montpellierensis]